jgi:hypothetical protein
VFALFTVCLVGFTIPWHFCAFFRSCHSCLTEQVRRQERPAAGSNSALLMADALVSLRRVLCKLPCHLCTRSCLRSFTVRDRRLNDKLICATTLGPRHLPRFLPRSIFLTPTAIPRSDKWSGMLSGPVRSPAFASPHSPIPE